MTASAPMASAVSQAPGNDVGHSYLFDAAQLQPDGGSEPDGPGREHHDLVRGPGLAAVDAVPRDRHTLVERGDVVGHRPGDHRQALAHDGVLDDQVLSHGAQRAAAADDAGGAACGLTTIRSRGFRPVTPAPDRHPRDAHAAEIQRPGREGALGRTAEALTLTLRSRLIRARAAASSSSGAEVRPCQPGPSTSQEPTDPSWGRGGWVAAGSRPARHSQCPGGNSQLSDVRMQALPNRMS
jgi:hypothetical protein